MALTPEFAEMSDRHVAQFFKEEREYHQITQTDTELIAQWRESHPQWRLFDFTSYPGFEEHKNNPHWIVCIEAHARAMDRMNTETNDIDDEWQKLRNEGQPKRIWKAAQQQANDKRKELGETADACYHAIEFFDPSLYM